MNNTLAKLEALYIKADMNFAQADTERSREYWKGQADAYRRALTVLRGY